MRTRTLLLTLALQLALAGPAAATVLARQIDGQVDDWPIDPLTWEPTAAGIEFAGGNRPDPLNGHPEDTTGGALTPVYPGYGGQLYDAEAAYATVQDGVLYFAIVTGLPQTGTRTVGLDGRVVYGNGLWAPGDIAIDFGLDGTYELGIETTGRSSTLTDRLAGGVYRSTGARWEDDWIGTPYRSAANDYTAANPTSMVGGELVGEALLVYSSTPVTGLGGFRSDRHYVIEGAVDLSLLGLAPTKEDFMLHWAMDCGNDAIAVDPPPAPAPEPGTLALLALGLPAALARRTRRGAAR